MSQRIEELDYIRVISVGIILLCHYFIFSDLNIGIGRYLGGVGNMVFFLLSGLLYNFTYQPDLQIVTNKIGGVILVSGDLLEEEL